MIKEGLGKEIDFEIETLFCGQIEIAKKNLLINALHTQTLHHLLDFYVNK